MTENALRLWNKAFDPQLRHEITSGAQGATTHRSIFSYERHCKPWFSYEMEKGIWCGFNWYAKFVTKPTSQGDCQSTCSGAASFSYIHLTSPKSFSRKKDPFTQIGPLPICAGRKESLVSYESWELNGLSLGWENNPVLMPYGDWWRRHKRALGQFLNSRAVLTFEPTQTRLQGSVCPVWSEAHDRELKLCVGDWSVICCRHPSNL